MALVLDLQRILLEILSSPAMMEQAEVLRIQTQVEEIRRLLWAISAVILDAQLRVLALKEQDLDDWVADVAATIVDLEDLLTSIIDRHERAVDSGGSSSRSSSFLLPGRLAFRVAILRKLKKMRCRLNGLVERGSAFNIWREPMESMDPFQDGYSAILEDEVKGRRVEYEELVELLQQQQMHPTMKDEEYSSIEMDAPFRIVIEGQEGMGKRTLARMIYHDEWVRQHFHHRLWVDASKFYGGDVIGIGREIARSMGHGNYIKIPETSSYQDMWAFVSQRLAGRRYLLILDGYSWFSWADKFEWDAKWNGLNRILLRVGGAGSIIIITTTSMSYREIEDPTYSKIVGDFNWRLEGILENDWREIFVRWVLAYQGLDQDKNREEEDMARRIAVQIYKRNLRLWFHPKDDPLNAKRMGSIFRYAEISRWQELVDGDLNIVKDQYENLIELYFHPTKYAHTVFYHALFPDDVGGDDDDIFLPEEFMHLMAA